MHPRPSILSLFDPLADSADDKENNVGDSSFFHPHSFKQPYAPTLRRRLVDVGDMTIDEPDIHDLLAEQEDLEDEIIQNIPHDDNDTLTFREMAKAATPKWSSQRPRANTIDATPLSSPTFNAPRTPLADIYVADDKTPVGRKLKSYKRALVSVTSKSPSVDHSDTRVRRISSPSVKSAHNSEDPSIPFTSPPRIEIQFDKSETGESPSSTETTLRSSVCTLDLPSPTGAPITDMPIPSAALGSSVCTLDLPATTGTLITDTLIPALDSSSSSRMSLDVPMSEVHLRPTLPSSDSMNRLSVDLASSFQIHLNSADTTFDLLTEKVSFFSKDGMDSLGDMDDSFDGVEFSEVKQFNDLPGKGATLREGLDTLKEPEKTSPPSEDGVRDERRVSLTELVEPCHKAKDTNVITHKELVTIDKSSPKLSTPATRNRLKPRVSNTVKKDRELPGPPFSESPLTALEKNSNALTTPSTSSSLQYPPRPVPALKIVKRSKIVSQGNEPANPSRRKSSIKVPPLPTLRTNLRSTSPEMASTSTINGNKPAGTLQSGRGVSRVVSAQAPLNPPTNGSGPRRVLISEGPKLTSVSSSRTTGLGEQPKAPSTSGGPRRIAVAPPVAEKAPVVTAKPAVQASSGLKQPQKYSTVGPSSAIPKPIARVAGSKLPAPSKARFGVPSGLAGGVGKGLPVRRVT